MLACDAVGHKFCKARELIIGMWNSYIMNVYLCVVTCAGARSQGQVLHVIDTPIPRCTNWNVCNSILIYPMCHVIRPLSVTSSKASVSTQEMLRNQTDWLKEFQQSLPLSSSTRGSHRPSKTLHFHRPR